MDAVGRAGNALIEVGPGSVVIDSCQSGEYQRSLPERVMLGLLLKEP